MKAIKITPPDGYEIDKKSSTFEEIVFKEIEVLPKKWGDLKCLKGYFVSSIGEIGRVHIRSLSPKNRNTMPTKKLAEASIALCQLVYLRDVYNGTWKADWRQLDTKYTIRIKNDEITTLCVTTFSSVLAFKESTTRDEFIANFRDLIEIAKPLL